MPHFFLDFQKFSFCLDLYTALIHNGNVDANELMKASSTSWSFFGAKINLDLWCYAIYAVFLCRKSVAIQVFQVHAYTPPHTKKTQDYVIITSVLKVSYQKNYIFLHPFLYYCIKHNCFEPYLLINSFWRPKITVCGSLSISCTLDNDIMSPLHKTYYPNFYIFSTPFSFLSKPLNFFPTFLIFTQTFTFPPTFFIWDTLYDSFVSGS